MPREHKELLLLGLVQKEFRKNLMFGVMKHRSNLGCMMEES